MASGIDGSDPKFKGIIPEKGVSSEDQAKQILNKILQDDITQGTTNLPGADALKSLGLTIDDGILKEKKLPQELKEFLERLKILSIIYLQLLQSKVL